MTRNEKARNCLFALGVLFVGLAPVLMLWPDTTQGQSVFFLLSGVILCLLSRMDDISEIGLLGLKAKLKRAINEAHATLEQVRSLAKIAAASSLSNTARSGLWGGIPDDMKLNYLEETQSVLSQLGYGAEEIKEVCQDYHNCILRNYGQTLLGGGASRVPSDLDSKPIDLTEWHTLRERQGDFPVSPEELKSFFEKYHFINEDLCRRLNGYAHYWNTKEFLDFEDYKNRKEWPHLRVRE
jgi:hypothetical protein